MRMTGTSGSDCRAAARISTPVTLGMRTSVSTMSGRFAAIASSPAFPPCAMRGLKPSLRRRILSESRIPVSSSTTRTLGLLSESVTKWLSYWLLSRPALRAADRRSQLRLLFGARQNYGEARAARRVVDENQAAMCFDRAMHDSEPKPAAPGLGGEERVEHPV